MQCNAIQCNAKQSNLEAEIGKKVSLHHHVKTKSLIQTCKGLCGILVVYWWYTGGILVVYWWYTGGILTVYHGILTVYHGILLVYWWYTGGIVYSSTAFFPSSSLDLSDYNFKINLAKLRF